MVFVEHAVIKNQVTVGADHDFLFALLPDLTGFDAISLQVAHYPPYCSKFNLLALQRHLTGLRRPIEHRLFPHVTRALQGVVLTSVEMAKRFMERTTTSKGLRVVVSYLQKVYLTGRKCAVGFKESMGIVFDEVMPNWNYVAVPGLG